MRDAPGISARTCDRAAGSGASACGASAYQRGSFGNGAGVVPGRGGSRSYHRQRRAFRPSRFDGRIQNFADRFQGRGDQSSDGQISDGADQRSRTVRSRPGPGSFQARGGGDRDHQEGSRASQGRARRFQTGDKRIHEIHFGISVGLDAIDLAGSRGSNAIRRIIDPVAPNPSTGTLVL